MRIELLTVGKELLIGRTLNTNSHWIGGRVARMGVVMSVITTVDDDLREISSTLREILRRRPAFVFVVGGLGPTPDDMTLKGIALGLRLKMKTSGKALSMIREHYAGRGMASIELTPARRKMALLPVGAEPVPNDVGTAPAVRLAHGRTVIFSLPGVPSEMKSIFTKSVEPELKRSIGPLSRRVYRLKLEGIMESALAPIILKAMKTNPGAYIKSHPKGVEDGVSKLEVDVAVIARDPRAGKKAALRIAESIARASTSSGAKVRSGPEPRW
jgi:molybdenum cofactor synthesis domain-containing protein